MFERAGEVNKTKKSDDVSQVNDTSGSERERPRTQTSVTSEMDSRKKTPTVTKSNSFNNKKGNGSSSTLSKLSAFSWSKASSMRKIASDPKSISSLGTSSDKNKSGEEEQPLVSLRSSPSGESCTHHKRTQSLDEFNHDISCDEPPAKKAKSSYTVSNYFEGKTRTKGFDSQSGCKSEVDQEEVKELQYQSYAGFLESIGEDSYTKLVDDPQQKTKKQTGEGIL